MFKPVPTMTLYGSYMELLEVNTAPSGTTNAGQVMTPAISKQYELGAKTAVGGMTINTALFRIEKANAYTDPTDLTYKQDGLEIHQGIELTGSGKLTDNLTFVGGFTGMDAHVASAKAAPATIGKIPVNVPEWQARAYLEYALPFVESLTLIAGSNYYGRRPVTATNSQFIPEALTADLGLRYQTKVDGHPVSVNLIANNVFDKRYWLYLDSSSTGMMLATSRTVSLSVKTTW
jgi:iron complex outermembrane receptor protein